MYFACKYLVHPGVGGHCKLRKRYGRNIRHFHGIWKKPYSFLLMT